MMRSLWTSASGMMSQQTSVDTISNNIANVNTAGFKKETVNFKSLLYANMPQPNAGGAAATIPMQVGSGVRVGSISKDFSMGSLLETGQPTDMAIEGEGFFALGDGESEFYTRDGSFRISPSEEGNMLVTTDGISVLSIDDEPIIFDSNLQIKDLIIGLDGVISYTDSELGESIEIAQLKIVQFPNKSGLSAEGSNLFTETAASGAPILEADGDGIVKSGVRAGYLEGSNVNIANEMVNLIVAQRAYELNSTAIKTADSMLQQANNLKQ